jgi:hypothetical protein
VATLVLLSGYGVARADGFFQVAPTETKQVKGDAGSLFTLQGGSEADDDLTPVRYWGYRGFGYRGWGGYYGGYRGWGYGGFYRPWGYGGFYRPYYGGFYNYGYSYSFYRPWYGYGFGYPYYGYYSPYYSFWCEGKDGDAELLTTDIKEPTANPYATSAKRETYNPYGNTVLTGFAAPAAAPERKSGFAESR